MQNVDGEAVPDAQCSQNHQNEPENENGWDNTIAKEKSSAEAEDVYELVRLPAFREPGERLVEILKVENHDKEKPQNKDHGEPHDHDLEAFPDRERLV